MSDSLVDGFYAVVNDAGFDPERHILPICMMALEAGDMVGFTGNDRGLAPTVYPLAREDDLWIFDHIGIVRQDYNGLDAVRMYISRIASESGGAEYFWVMIRKPQVEIIRD